MDIQIKPKPKNQNFMMEYKSQTNGITCGVALDSHVVDYIKISYDNMISIKGLNENVIGYVDKKKPIIIYLDLLSFGYLYELEIVTNNEGDTYIWINWQDKEENYV